MCGFMLGQFVDLENIPSQALKIKYRGPDSTEQIIRKTNGVENLFVCFHRLAIMDLSEKGNQPFENNRYILVCNGEIYNFKTLKKEFYDYSYVSESDCEVILPMVEKLGLEETCKRLDGEFVFAIYDKQTDKISAARDPLGIRPLFYGIAKDTKKLAFASEMKALVEICNHVKPFPPSHFCDDGVFKQYVDITTHNHKISSSLEEIKKSIRELLIDAVGKRLDSDAPMGFLLSGGLDSSLVCGIAVKYFGKKITTFAVGLNENPRDAKFARIAANFLETDHHEYLFDREEIFKHLDDLIFRLETFDITTIRASIGMDAICRYIKENTKIKVLFTGEVSDELFGYKYTDYAPSPEEFQKEAKKRIEELYMYDALRADRCVSSNSLEARVPFGDKKFVDYVMSLDPKLKMNTTGMGKSLLREAFKDEKILPDEILYREKEAFSDGQGHKVLDYLTEYAEARYSSLDTAKKYKHATPHTKEALLYRDIFESYFPNYGGAISGFWLPNSNWENCNVADPSARVLPNYEKGE